MADQSPPAPGSFCWNELMTGDVPAATEFYTKLFGWRTQAMDMGPAGTYTLFRSGDKDVGGMMTLPQEGVPPHWLCYVAVADVDGTVSRAQTLGGQILHPPTDIPGIGRFSVLRDPTGAVIAVFRGMQG